ncbi:DHA2 family efflux MFS transporter permease subunit [Cumulibacter manganitolerans]|uniref:DHA2 family efflux MFS transporter permease subunit n=1 Tax=Cumulibacter manganitolerans TaxID=1884992 RepID=UPI001298142B|nr:DHA2 family efflux MFS transporter permease subunit [Cumulibacter manganitolerans]
MESRRPALVLLATGMAMFAVFLDTTILYVAFPSIGATFRDVGPGGLSWVLNAYTITFAALLIPAGRLADRIGRRRLFLGAVVLFTAASMLCGLAVSVPMLVASRVLQAVGAAAMVPSSLAVVLQSFPKEQVPRAVAVWGAVGAVAGAAGPSLGSLVVERLDWRWAFFINLPVGVFSWLLSRRVLPEGRERNSGPIPDPFGAALLIVALSCISYGIVHSEGDGWASPVVLGTITAGILVVGVFVWRCARVSAPVLDLRLFRSANFSVANTAMLIYSVGFSTLFLGNILFLTGVWHYSILQAGLAVSIGPTIVAILAPRMGRLAGRVGQRAILLPGGLVWASASVWLMLRADAEPAWAATFLPATVIGAVGVSMCMPQLGSAAVKDLPPNRLGQGSAVSQATRNLGTTFGVSLTIALLAQHGGLQGFHHTWLVVLISGSCVSLLAILLPRHRSLPLSAEEVAGDTAPAVATSAAGPSAGR